MSRAICGLCGADWGDDGPTCECRRAADRVVAHGSSTALQRFATLARLGLDPQTAADYATGRASIGEA